MPGDPSAPPEDPRSPIRFPPELPISARVSDIATPSTSTRSSSSPARPARARRRSSPRSPSRWGAASTKMIGVTQPRRIAATSVAARVASELGSALGTDVGYQIRFEDRTSPATYVKFMTDGILLAEIQGDRLLRRYDTIIIDEAHERSLTIDFLLGWLKRILPERPDLKVVVSSATLETERFSEFFGGAPVIEVEGRTYPVDVLYEPPPDDVDLPEAVAERGRERDVARPARRHPRLPAGRARDPRDGERARSPQETCGTPSSSRSTRASRPAEQAQGVREHPAAARDPRDERRRDVADHPGHRLRHRHGPRAPVALRRRARARRACRSRASPQASADQRKGRCGRVRDGHLRPPLRRAELRRAARRSPIPEIKRTGLAGVILRMKSLGLGDVEDFPFLDPPHPRVDHRGLPRPRGARRARTRTRELTPLGERLARFPVDPRIGRMILAGAEHGCLREVLVIAAALNVQDPRERPREAQQKADELHRRFRDERSDFVGLLRLWAFVREAESKGTSHLRRVCKESFLSFVRVREWGEIHRQLEDVVRELGSTAPAPAPPPTPAASRSAPIAGEPAEPSTARSSPGCSPRSGSGTPRIAIYVGRQADALRDSPVVGARAQAAGVDHGVRAGRDDAALRAHGREDRAGVAARGRAAPPEAQLLRSALVGEVRAGLDQGARHALRPPGRSATAASTTPASRPPRRGACSSTTRSFAASTGRGAPSRRRTASSSAEVARLRDKARRSDMLADDDALLAVLRPARPRRSVVNGKTFEAWREVAEKDDPRVLLLSLEDVLAGDPDLAAGRLPRRAHPSRCGHARDATASIPRRTTTASRSRFRSCSCRSSTRASSTGRSRVGTGEDRRAAPRASAGASAASSVRSRSSRGRLAEQLVPFDGPMIPALAAAIATTCRSGRAGGVVPPGRRARLLCASRAASSARRARSSAQRQGHRRSRGGTTERARGRRGRTQRRRRPGSGRASPPGTSASSPPFVARRVSGTRGSHLSGPRRSGHVGRPRAPRVFGRRRGRDTRPASGGFSTLAARGPLSAIAPRLPPALRAPERRAAVARRERGVPRDACWRASSTRPSSLAGTAPLPRTKARLRRRSSRRDAAHRAVLPRASPRPSRALSIGARRTLQALRSAGQAPRREDGDRRDPRPARAALSRRPPRVGAARAPRASSALPSRRAGAPRARDRRSAQGRREARARSRPCGPRSSRKQRTARDQETAVALRWAFEELRVAIFAPELKTPVPVSIAKLTAALAALR